MFFGFRKKTAGQFKESSGGSVLGSDRAKWPSFLNDDASKQCGASPAIGKSGGVAALFDVTGTAGHTDAPAVSASDLSALSQVAGRSDSQQAPAGEDRQKKIEQARRFSLTLGQVVAVAINSKQHQAMRLAELRVRVVPAVLNSQFALASRRDEESGLQRPVTALLWASVSDEVDQRLSGNGSGEIKLERAEWCSGPHIWLVDVFGDQETLPGLLRQLHETKWKGRFVKMYVRDPDGRAAMRVIGAS